MESLETRTGLVTETGIPRGSIIPHGSRQSWGLCPLYFESRSSTSTFSIVQSIQKIKKPRNSFSTQSQKRCHPRGHSYPLLDVVYERESESGV